MKINELFESVRVTLNNEEREFMKFYGKRVPLSNLDDHRIWIAQNLVRKGMYEISNDDRELVKIKNVFNSSGPSL